MKRKPTSSLKCSFCGKAQGHVRRLIEGPNVCICEECVAVCLEIIDDGQADAEAALLCALCREPITSSDRLDLPRHGSLCPGCANAVIEAALRRVASTWSEETL